MQVRIPNAKLRQLLKLSKRKEALLAQVQDVERDMLQLEQEFGKSFGQKNGKGRITVSNSSRKRGRIRLGASSTRRRIRRR